MFCDTCNKLAILNVKKTCMSCKGDVYKNISVLCETCSSRNNCCAACLKKTFKGLENPIYKNSAGGCKSCGK